MLMRSASSVYTLQRALDLEALDFDIYQMQFPLGDPPLSGAASCKAP
jgi:hypothetical protein